MLCGEIFTICPETRTEHTNTLQGMVDFVNIRICGICRYCWAVKGCFQYMWQEWDSRHVAMYLQNAAQRALSKTSDERKPD